MRRMRNTVLLVTSLFFALGCGRTVGSGDAGEDAGEQQNTGGGTGGGSGDVDAGVDAGIDAGWRNPDGGTGYPIKHIIVIVKENHTFDNYFGSFPGAEGTSTYQLSDGGTAMCGRAPDNTLRDMDHSHGAGITDWAGGKMNGWDLVPGTSTRGDNLAYAQYREADIPNYWAYARTFTLGDHFFSQNDRPQLPRSPRGAGGAGRLGQRQPRHHHHPPVLGLRPGLQHAHHRGGSAHLHREARLPLLRHEDRARRAAPGHHLEVLRLQLLRAAGDLDDVQRGPRRSATARSGPTSSAPTTSSATSTRTNCRR